MNRVHHWICRSAWWRRTLSQSLIPWALQDIALGHRTLEIGPGPGLTSQLLQQRIPRLICAELDYGLAHGLAHGLRRQSHTDNLHVLCGDAALLPLGSGSVDSVLAFTMLHHVSSASRQDALFAEVARVLRPGGVFAGTDSIQNPLFRLLHWGDTMQMVHPGTLTSRLKRAGFAHASVETRRREFRFRAWRANVT